MSSRQISDARTKQAGVLYKSLKHARELIVEGERNVEVIKQAMANLISEAGMAEIEYIEIVDKENLKPLLTVNGECLIALAVKFGQTRLIDNIILEV